jgi:two-component system, LytTR family, sensor kinase
MKNFISLTYILQFLKSTLFRHYLLFIAMFISQAIQIQWIVNTEFTKLYWFFVLKDTLSNLLFFYCISYWVIPNITGYKIYPTLIITVIINYLIAYSSNFVGFGELEKLDAYAKMEVLGNPTEYSIKFLGLIYNKVGFFEGLFNSGVMYVTIVYYVSIPSILILLKIIKDFYSLQIKNINYQKELARLELDFLKTQINPHFLFNTLNNIYSMIAYKDSLAAESVLRLSDMMRFSLYETDNQKVTLNKEIEFIENYLGLEKIRHGKYVEVVFSMEGDLDKKIAPFIFIALIENAFKHGILPAPKYSLIDINLRIADDILFFRVKNTLNTDLKKKQVGGVGLKNLRKRLALIYPNTYQLTTEQSQDFYVVTLTIQNLETHN